MQPIRAMTMMMTIMWPKKGGKVASAALLQVQRSCQAALPLTDTPEVRKQMVDQGQHERTTADEKYTFMGTLSVRWPECMPNTNTREKSVTPLPA